MHNSFTDFIYFVLCFTPPLDSLTLSIPSLLELVRTSSLVSMYWYICWYDPLSADWEKQLKNIFTVENIYFEEVEGGAPAQTAVLDLGLGEKILGGAEDVVDMNQIY